MFRLLLYLVLSGDYFGGDAKQPCKPGCEASSHVCSVRLANGYEWTTSLPFSVVQKFFGPPKSLQDLTWRLGALATFEAERDQLKENAANGNQATGY